MTPIPFRVPVQDPLDVELHNMLGSCQALERAMVDAQITKNEPRLTVIKERIQTCLRWLENLENQVLKDY